MSDPNSESSAIPRRGYFEGCLNSAWTWLAGLGVVGIVIVNIYEQLNKPLPNSITELGDLPDILGKMYDKDHAVLADIKGLTFMQAPEPINHVGRLDSIALFAYNGAPNAETYERQWVGNLVLGKMRVRAVLEVHQQPGGALQQALVAQGSVGVSGLYIGSSTMKEETVDGIIYRAKSDSTQAVFAEPHIARVGVLPDDSTGAGAEELLSACDEVAGNPCSSRRSFIVGGGRKGRELIRQQTVDAAASITALRAGASLLHSMLGDRALHEQ